MDIATRFMLTGLFWLTASLLQGLWMGATNQMQYLPLHVIMSLSGGVVGVLYGLILRNWQGAAKDALANPGYWIFNGGVLVQAIGSIIRAQNNSNTVIAVGSLIVIAGALAMLLAVWRNSRA